jgi:hypothetical protein
MYLLFENLRREKYEQIKKYCCGRPRRRPLPSFRIERLFSQTQKQKIVCESKQFGKRSIRNQGMHGQRAAMAPALSLTRVLW